MGAVDLDQCGARRGQLALEPAETFLQHAHLRLDVHPVAAQLVAPEQPDGRGGIVAFMQQATDAVDQVLAAAFQLAQATAGILLLALVQADQGGEAERGAHRGSPMIWPSCLSASPRLTTWPTSWRTKS